jgi:hypothetical protein
MDEFREVIKSSLGSSDITENSSNMMSGMGFPDIKGQLADIVYGIKDPPPGT